MLYVFKSKAAPDLIMLQPNGERVLVIIGKEPGPKGIILPEQMPDAIAALGDALEREDASIKEAIALARANGEVPPRLDGVSLRQRAVPMLEMLQRCNKAGESIVWGV